MKKEQEEAIVHCVCNPADKDMVNSLCYCCLPYVFVKIPCVRNRPFAVVVSPDLVADRGLSATEPLRAIRKY